MMHFQGNHFVIKNLLIIMLAIMVVTTVVWIIYEIKNGNLRVIKAGITNIALAFIGVKGSLQEHYLSSLVYSIILSFFLIITIIVAIVIPSIYAYLLGVFLALFSMLFIVNTVMIRKKTAMNGNESNIDNDFLVENVSN